MTVSRLCLARLCLADGTCFEGVALGEPRDEPTVGEVVFTTGMTGYQEVLTDPSFRGQIVVMAAPQIGNTGVNGVDPESGPWARPPIHAAGFVVREASGLASNHRAEASLASYLASSGVAGLTNIDTRRLVTHLRTHGSQNGAIGTGSVDELVAAARAARSMEGLDLVREVTCESITKFGDGTPEEFRTLAPRSAAERPKVVAVDYGAKRNILRSLVDVGFDVTVVPARTGAVDLLALGPDGIFLSNGPGDPAVLDHAIATTRDLLGKRPIFGICLGHQILALAVGARTFKLKFGHRGLNQPVLALDTGRVEITSQNHGFAVDVDSLPKSARPSYRHLNDGTSEGLEVPEADAFSVQFHPEAAPGPHDTLHLFQKFYDRVGRA
jgi:carbamoyl-phosphate synthase small subunit